MPVPPRLAPRPAVGPQGRARPSRGISAAPRARGRNVSSARLALYPAVTPSPSSTLCLACGMCCDGTLFTRVAVEPGEVARLEAHGLTLAERPEGGRALPQPCAALDGRCCTVYADRPAGCRRYRCNLLVALEEGEVGLADAEATVADAHARRARATEAAGAPLAQARRTLREGGLPDAAVDVLHDLERFLDRHFRGRTGSG